MVYNSQLQEKKIKYYTMLRVCSVFSIEIKITTYEYKELSLKLIDYYQTGYQNWLVSFYLFFYDMDSVPYERENRDT